MIALFSVTWFMSKIVIQMLACWQGRFHRQRSLKIQKDIPYLHIVGNLVREEESLKFAGIECPHHVILFFLISYVLTMLLNSLC